MCRTWFSTVRSLSENASAIARGIAENTSAVSVTLIRQMMWRMLGADHPMEAHKVDSRAIRYMGASPDVREGVESFLEKRPPRFSMRPSTDMPEWYVQAWRDADQLFARLLDLPADAIADRVFVRAADLPAEAFVS